MIPIHPDMDRDSKDPRTDDLNRTESSMKSAIEYVRDEARRLGFEKIAQVLDRALEQLTDDARG